MSDGFDPILHLYWYGQTLKMGQMVIIIAVKHDWSYVLVCCPNGGLSWMMKSGLERA